MTLLLLRPEPGASASLARLRALGLDAVAAPLFTILPRDWTAPDPAGIDAVLLTSAHAARCAGPGLAPFLRHPVFAVGEATAEAAQAAGFSAIEIGPSDGAALLQRVADLGYARLLHLAGREHKDLARSGVTIDRRIVYAAEAAESLAAEAQAALAGPEPLVLLHSPRAAATFATLADRAGLDRSRIALAAISPAAAEAAGAGWKAVHAAAAPRDAALLELAAKLCQNPAPADSTAGEEADEMDSDFPPADEPPAPVRAEPRKSALPALLLALIAFLLGLAAMGWLLANWPAAQRLVGIAEEAPPEIVAAPPPASATEPAAEPQRLVLDPEMTRRVASLEQRLSEIDLQSRAAVGNADRAEGLLLAFAARRALDRGVALGYLEGLLRQRFGQSQPQAVGTIIAAARQPVTLDQLHQGLQDAESQLVGGAPDQGWWAALRQELDGLVTIRRQGTPSTIPAERYRRALRRLEAGQVDVALAEVLRMPGQAQAQEWIDNARRYVGARRALDAIETAALLEPRALPPPVPAAPAEDAEAVTEANTGETPATAQ